MNFSIIVDIRAVAVALTSADRRFLNFLRSRPNFPMKNFTQPRFYIRKKVHEINMQIWLYIIIYIITKLIDIFDITIVNDENIVFR